MKTFTRFAIAAIVIFSVAFMSTNHVWAANPAQTTGGPGSTHESAGEWFADFPNGSLPEGCGAGLSYSDIASDVHPFPETGHSLHIISQAIVTTSCPNLGGMHLVCFKTQATGGAIFWWEPTLLSWVPLANFQDYPTFDGVAYTCVNTWFTGTFAYGYIVP